MSVLPDGLFLVLPLLYLLFIAAVAVLLYLVLRFAIRDGLRGHQVWRERTGRDQAPAKPDADA